VVIGVGRNRHCRSGGVNRCQLAEVKGGAGMLFVCGKQVGQGEIEQAQAKALPADEFRRRSLRAQVRWTGSCIRRASACFDLERFRRRSSVS